MEKQLPGVYKTTKKDQSVYYRSSLTYNRKHISLGSYDSMIKAHAAYLEANSILLTPTMTLHDYSEHRILSFEKWVILLNFRDNGIYFATPIYIRNKYFEYHLSPAFVLKFDIDDLFYYSSHKIMRRGRHFFVADYGMQVNIVSRYGIKNYGIPGKDYNFVNGDDTDFRYENIEILNAYHGVSSFRKNNKTRYRAKIHIHGNYTIGTYDTPQMAAIAYNKAIDILKKAGNDKNFTPNDLSDLSPLVYADIYSSVPVSSKIRHWKLS